MKTVFVTNTPNYCHRRFAESIGAETFKVRHIIPDGIPFISLPVNGWATSKHLPEADVYFAESIMDYYPIYFRKPEGKKIILLAEDTLFKLQNMAGPKKRFIIKTFQSADGFIAISDLCKDLLRKYTDKPCRVAYPFPHEDFSDVKANLESKKILFIGRADPSKGYHNLVEAVRLLRKADSEWELYLIGDCGDDVMKQDGVHIIGRVDDMKPYFKKCSLLIHPAEFDPCPATVFEAMQAGIVPIISENVGQSRIFSREGLGDLILEDIEPKDIAAKVLEVKIKGVEGFSKRAKKVVSNFTEKKKLGLFKKEFKELLKEIE